VDYHGINLYRDILPGLRDWQICASLDGTGSIGEYIRTGLDYDRWVDNFGKAVAIQRHPRQVRIDFTLTLPGMFEVGKITELAKQFGVDILAKVIFSFSPDIIMSPLALPRHLLEPWLDELIAETTGAMQAVLTQLKNRPTFEEQWPDTYQQSLAQGRDRMLQLEQIRTQPITMTDILSGRPDVLKWWMNIG
jgi:hypothetical protein